MQYSEMKTLLKGRLARFSASTSLDVYINGELNAAMTAAEDEGWHPWFLEKDSAVLTLAEDAYSVALPSDFLAEMISYADEDLEGMSQLGMLDSASNKYLPLKRGKFLNPIRSGDITLTEAAQAIPTEYSLVELDGLIYVNAWSNAAQSLVLRYVAKGDRFTAAPADAEEPIWCKYAPEYIIALCGMRISSMYVKNKSASQVFTADVSRERMKLKQRHTTVLEGREVVNAEN